MLHPFSPSILCRLPLISIGFLSLLFFGLSLPMIHSVATGVLLFTLVNLSTGFYSFQHLFPWRLALFRTAGISLLIVDRSHFVFGFKGFAPGFSSRGLIFALRKLFFVLVIITIKRSCPSMFNLNPASSSDFESKFPDFSRVSLW